MKKLFPVLLFIALCLFIPLTGSILPVKAQAPVGNYLELKGGHLKAWHELAFAPSAFSFEVWVKPETAQGKQTILSIGDKLAGRFHYEVKINGGSLQFNYHYNSTSQKIITSGNIIPGSWRHLAVSVDQLATNLYLNGNRIFSTSGAASLLPIGPDIIIARSYQESILDSEIFKGEIDEIRISAVSRDVPSLWTAGVYDYSLVADSDTVVLWRLDETRGKIIAEDASGNNIDADLVGGDGKIHFFGVLATPTPFVFALPTISWVRPVLPTLSIRRPINEDPDGSVNPTAMPPARDWDIRPPRPARRSFLLY